MTRNENHGLSNCIGSRWCRDCGGTCSQDEALTRDNEPRESWAEYRARILKALEQRRREGYPGLPKEVR